MIIQSGKVRNDIIKGLKLNIQLPSVGQNAKKAKITYKYEGKYGQGYDGCGSHTHDD